MKKSEIFSFRAIGSNAHGESIDMTHSLRGPMFGQALQGSLTKFKEVFGHSDFRIVSGYEQGWD